MFLGQNAPETKDNDGFPIVQIMFDIVKECLNLIEIRPLNGKKSQTRNELRYWRHHQKVFGIVCEKYFSNNVYETFCEYFFHMIMNFQYAWKNSTEKMQGHLEWMSENYNKKIEIEHSDPHKANRI